MTKTEVKMFSQNAQHHTWWKSNAAYHLRGTEMEGWWFELVLQPCDVGTLQSLSPPWTHSIAKYSRVKCETIGLTAKDCSNFGDATRQWSNLIEILWWDIKRAAYKKQPSKLNQLKRPYNEEWDKKCSWQHKRLNKVTENKIQIIVNKVGCTHYWITWYTQVFTHRFWILG